MLRSTCVMVLSASGILAAPAGAVDLLTPVSQARSVSVTASGLPLVRGDAR